MLPATRWPSKPPPCRSSYAAWSFSGRRATSVTACPSSASIRATASPMPLEAPVTIAARSVMRSTPLVGDGAGAIQSRERVDSSAMPRLLAMLMAAVALSPCGSGDGAPAPAPPDPPAAKPADFPSAEGKTLKQLTAGLKQGAILTPSSASSQKVGSDNRLGFAIVDSANKQIDVSEVAVYTAKPDGSELRGPFVARKESLDVATPYRSAHTASDLANGKTFYVAKPGFASAGAHVAVGSVRLDDRLVVADAPAAPGGGV